MCICLAATMLWVRDSPLYPTNPRLHRSYFVFVATGHSVHTSVIFMGLRGFLQGPTMCNTQRRNFIASSIAFSAVAPIVITETFAAADVQTEAKVWICPPCGCPDDAKEFPARGRCPSCDMELIEKVKTNREAPTTMQSPGSEHGASAALK